MMLKVTKEHYSAFPACVTPRFHPQWNVDTSVSVFQWSYGRPISTTQWPASRPRPTSAVSNSVRPPGIIWPSAVQVSSGKEVCASCFSLIVTCCCCTHLKSLQFFLLNYKMYFVVTQTLVVQTSENLKHLLLFQSWNKNFKYSLVHRNNPSSKYRWTNRAAQELCVIQRWIALAYLPHSLCL